MEVKVEIERSSGDMVLVFDENVRTEKQIEKLRVVLYTCLALEKELQEFVAALSEEDP